MPPTVVILCLLLPSVGLIGPVAAEDPPAPTPAEQERIRGQVAHLLKELDSDRYEVRRRAAGRLERLVARPELGRLLSAEFHRVLVRLDTSFEVRWHLEQWCRRLPEIVPEVTEKVSDKEINRLVRKLGDDSHAVRSGAARRLESVLFRDEYLPRVKQALQRRLAGPVDAETAISAKKLLEMARPAMVAEYWQGGRNLNRQFLLVGVPSQEPGALRPSHFDRVDDKVAHCVSGNNLSEGDYPVGVAFPHPRQEGALFHLVNLPTPRRRLTYELSVKTDEAARLTALSRRTVDRFLAQKIALSEPELVMLAQLDPREVSRFAGRYFSVVEDRQLPPSGRRRSGGRPSRFGMICAQLAANGTQHAMPGLLEAIDKDRFLPPNQTAPYRYHWIAALSIAVRDPWPAADDWLGSLIPRRDLLVEGRPNAPELGATAAGVLAKRYRNMPPKSFRLHPAPDPLLMTLGVNGYVFPSADARKQAQQWWQRETAKRKEL